MKLKNYLTAGLMAGAVLLPFFSQAKKADESKKYDSYLFVYFPSNADENLYYALGRDGFNFTPLNGGRMVMSSDTVARKRGIRDPHILRGEDGKFYMVATDMKSAEGWASNRGIVMYTSDD